MATDTTSTLALLIDGDNVSPKIVVGLLAEIANYGAASVKRDRGCHRGHGSLRQRFPRSRFGGAVRSGR